MHIVHRSDDSRKKLELSTSEDRLKAFLKVVPGPEAAHATEDDLFAELVGVLQADLIDRDVVKDIVSRLRQGVGCEERRVAKGKEPMSGRNGRLVWLVRRYSTSPSTEKEERVFSDFFNLGLFENVRSGREIARLYPPHKGKDGVDVLGKRLPATNGSPASVKFDASIELRPSGRIDGYSVLVSTKAGYVREEGANLSVRDVLEVSGDVDYSLGHIDFIGAVSIAGDVHKGFDIRAGGPITVKGSVHGDNTLTSEQSITVGGYHHGGEGSIVTAKGSYSVRVAHQVNAEVQGDIVVIKESSASSLRTAGSIGASAAAIVGGTIWMVRGIEARELGTAAGIATVVEVHAAGEISREFDTLQANVRRHEDAIKVLELHLGPFATNRSRLGALTTAHRDKLVTLIDKYDRLKQSLSKLKASSAEIRTHGTSADVACVSVHATAHAGVRLVNGKGVMEFKEPVSGPISFVAARDEGEWSTVAFIPIQIETAT